MAKQRYVRVAGIPEGFREHRFCTGDITMNYVEGPENGLPLLLVPGQMEAWQGYKCVMPALSEWFHVFVPDLRGHGKSTWTPGKYSYNICGVDLRRFIEDVIGRQTIVAGLSSGAVLAIWLAAYAPELVLGIISEDPPIFSSIYPRICEEKFLTRTFQVAVETLGKGGERDLAAYLGQMGVPFPGETNLRMIPPLIVKILSGMANWNRRLNPKAPYDVPLLPFSMRAGMKFLMEYDTDFSRATIEGDLSRGFDPVDALRRVRCPMLLMRVKATRHETWGILGAIDDNDLVRIQSLVNDLSVVQIEGRHEIHMDKPDLYVNELIQFVESKIAFTIPGPSYIKPV